MKKIWNLVWLNLIQIIHNRAELVAILLLPLVFTVIFGVVFGGTSAEPKVSVVFVDKDESAYSKQVSKLLKEQEAFSVKTTTQAKAEQLLSNKEIAAAVVVGKGFGKAIENGTETDIEILKLPDSTRALAVVELVSGIAGRMAADAKSVQVTQRSLNKARRNFLESPLPLPPSSSKVSQPAQMSQIPVKNLPGPVRQELTKTFPYLESNPSFSKLYELADEKWEPEPPVSIKAKEVVASKIRGDSTIAQGFSHSSLGFTLMFVMFIVFGGAQGILEERELGTLSRLLTTPTTKPQLLLGEIAGLYARGAVQAAILIILGALLFKVPWGEDPLPVVLIIGTFILATTGLAILLSAVSRTRGQMIAMTNVLVISLAMLGGCFWPIEITPEFMQKIAQFTPTGWAMSGLVDIVVRHQGLSEAMLPSLVLLGFATVSFAVGLKFLKFE